MRRLIVLSLLLSLVMLAIPPAAFTAAAQQPSASTPAPLKEAEIIKGLVGGISNKRMAALVSEYGVDFALAPESEERLRGAGADEELLTAIRAKAAKPASATLLVTTDMDCDWKLDGVSQGRLKADDVKTVQVPSGEHLVQAISADGQDKWQTSVTVGSSGQKTLQIPLAGVRQGRQEKEEHEAAERKAAEEARRPTWIDPQTGLMWARQDNGSAVSWHQAKDYCASLTVAGYSNWRLPTIDELAAIYDPTHDSVVLGGSGHYHIKGGIKLTSSGIWSGSCKGSCQKSSWLAWIFYFFSGERREGDIDNTGTSADLHALCARHPGE